MCYLQHMFKDGDLHGLVREYSDFVLKKLIIAGLNLKALACIMLAIRR